MDGFCRPDNICSFRALPDLKHMKNRAEYGQPLCTSARFNPSCRNGTAPKSSLQGTASRHAVGRSTPRRALLFLAAKLRKAAFRTGHAESPPGSTGSTGAIGGYLA